MPANQELFDAQLRHAVGIRRLTQGETKRMIRLLLKADKDLTAKLKARLKKGDSLTSKRMQSLVKDIRATRSQLWRQINKQSKNDMLDLAKAEQQFTADMLKGTLPVQLEFAGAELATLRSIVNTKPFAGGANAARTLDQWWRGVEAVDQTRILEAIQMGMTQGETVDDMVRRVTQATDLTRRNAEAVVRTGVNHVSNQAREAFFDENQDVVRALRWTSTLDGRTSAICRARDGHYGAVEGTSAEGVPTPWLKPQTARPPAHPNCRSVMVAVLDDENLAEVLPDRPFVRDTRTRRRREIDFRADAKAKAGANKWKKMTVKQRNAAIKRQKRAWTKENVGTIKGDITYDDWLRKQPKEFQDQVLGKAKAEAFRKGLKLDKFVDRKGNELTLKQLQKAHPEFVVGKVRKQFALDIDVLGEDELSVLDLDDLDDMGVDVTKLSDAQHAALGKRLRAGEGRLPPARKPKVVVADTPKFRDAKARSESLGIDDVKTKSGDPGTWGIEVDDVAERADRLAVVVDEVDNLKRQNGLKLMPHTTVLVTDTGDALGKASSSGVVNISKHPPLSSFRRSVDRVRKTGIAHNVAYKEGLFSGSSTTHIRNTVRHEWGHIFDFASNSGPARGVKWHNIIARLKKKGWNIEKELSQYANTNLDESFAEAFSYYTSPHYLEGELKRLPVEIEEYIKETLDFWR